MTATGPSDGDDPIGLAFVCVQNAGRSQMATAFAERERDRRGLDDRVEIYTGGTAPADHVHPEVVETMAEVGVDLSDRTPREISPADLQEVDYVLTMGCTAEDVCPAVWSGESRDWALEDPDGQPPERVREIRETVRERVRALFDELFGPADAAKTG